MKKFFDYIVDTRGDAVNGASVAVKMAGTSNDATLYSDNGVTTTANPVTTDTKGYFSFYIADGWYDIVVSGTGVTTQTITDVEIHDELSSSYLTETKTATAGQKAFTLTTMSYVPGINNLSAYINGVRQAPSAYTETDANTVTFTSGLDAGDTVQFVSSDSVSVSSGTADTTTYDQGGAGSVATNVGAKLREVVSVKDFGAVGNGIADDTAAIQAAIDAAEAAGGGTVFLPTGTYIVSSTLTIDSDAVIIKGENGCVNTNDTSWKEYAATTIKWNGSSGGTVIRIATPISASRTKTLQSCGIKNLLIDCQTVAGGIYAGIGVDVEGLRGGIFHGISIYKPSLKGFNLDIMSDTTNLSGGDLGDVQKCLFSHCIVSSLYTPSSAHGFVLGDTNVTGSSGNVSVNNFIDCDSLTYNGTGFYFGGSDSNTLTGIRTYVHPSGSGYGVEFYGAATAGQRARGNIINGLQGGGEVRAVTGTVDPSNNFIYGYSRENGRAVPTDLSGSPIFYIDDAGTGRLKSIYLEGSVPFVEATGTAPRYVLEETGATADQQRWHIKATGDELLIQGLTDADSGGGKLVAFTRSSQSIASMELRAGMVLNIAPVTTSALPGSPSEGDRLFVTDSDTATFGSTFSGGGSNNVPVYYDGTSWRVG